eukprot:gene17512-biopygen13682
MPTGDRQALPIISSWDCAIWHTIFKSGRRDDTNPRMVDVGKAQSKEYPGSGEMAVKSTRFSGTRSRVIGREWRDSGTRGNRRYAEGGTRSRIPGTLLKTFQGRGGDDLRSRDTGGRCDSYSENRLHRSTFFGTTWRRDGEVRDLMEGWKRIPRMIDSPTSNSYQSAMRSLTKDFWILRIYERR